MNKGELSMKWVKFFFVLLLLVVCNSNESYAQVFADDMKAMNAFYQNQKQFQMEVKVSIVGTDNKSLPVGYKQAVVKKYNGKFLYTLDKTEMLLTESELIIVNNAEKALIYRTITKKEYEAIQKEYYTSQLDSAIQKYDSVRFEGIKEGKKYYSIYTSRGVIKKTELVLDEKENYMRELTYDYNPKLNKNVKQVQISFINKSAEATVDPGLFLPGRFIIREGKKIRPVSKYAQYDFRNVDE